MKKNILIAGGTGFIGFHLIRKLKKDFNIISISSNRPKKIRKIAGINYIKCDIIKKKSLINKLNSFKVDFVINLAGYVDHSNKIKTLQSHFYGCKNLVDYYRSKNIKLFIQIGSSLEYGRQNSPHNEKSKCRPIATYGKSKLKSTEYILRTQKKFSFPAIVLRLYQIYGPNQSTNRLIPITIAACLKNRKFKCSSGLQIRDFLFVDDLTNLIKKIILSKKKINGVFNIGSNNPVKVREVITMIRNKIKKGHPEFGKIKMRNDEVMEYFPNLKKISKKLSLKPKFSLKNGLDKTIKFYKQNA